jgi:hypothetical protein
METKVLETIPFWICYPFLAGAVFMLVACLWACGVHLFAASHVPRVPYRRLPGYIRTLFLTACAVIVCWFLFRSMFIRFHAVLIGADHIELVYCWPRPNSLLQASSLRSASVHQYRDKGCRLEILTDRDTFRSVDSDEVQAAKQIQEAVDIMTKK